MTKFTRALVMALVGALGMTSLAAAEKPEPVKEEKPRTCCSRRSSTRRPSSTGQEEADHRRDGSVPTGG